VPYLRCPNCGVTAYSAPSYAGSATCSNCCARLREDARVYHDVTADRPGTLARRLSSDVTAPARARRAAAELRTTIGAAHFPDVELLISELVTNAVQHGRHDGERSIGLEIEVRPGQVRVSVDDQGAGFEPPPEATNGQPRGRGLMIVDRLASRWGIEPRPPTTVWFELDTGRAPGL
jgi:anti-sigma regulatory factor (Ser/Thr protein kinase)